MALATQVEKKNLVQKRQKIMQAAMTVFAKQGFYNSTVADVASLANVADGTIYLYFKNKDDLLISIFEQSMELFISSAKKELDGLGSASEKLKSFIHLHLKLVSKNQKLAQVIQIELRQSSKFIKEYANEKFFEYLGIVKSIIEQGQKDGSFRKDADATILKRSLFGAIDEIALEWILMKKKRYSIDEAANQISRLFVNGLKV